MYLGQELLAVEDAGLYVDNKLRDFGEGWDVNTQHLHPELPVTVPHRDGEHTFMGLLIDGQLLVGTWEKRGAERPLNPGLWLQAEHHSVDKQNKMVRISWFKSVPATPVQSSTWAQSSFWTRSRSGSGGFTRTRWISSPFFRHWRIQLKFCRGLSPYRYSSLQAQTLRIGIHRNNRSHLFKTVSISNQSYFKLWWLWLHVRVGMLWLQTGFRHRQADIPSTHTQHEVCLACVIGNTQQNPFVLCLGEETGQYLSKEENVAITDQNFVQKKEQRSRHTATCAGESSRETLMVWLTVPMWITTRMWLLLTWKRGQMVKEKPVKSYALSGKGFRRKLVIWSFN